MRNTKTAVIVIIATLLLAPLSSLAAMNSANYSIESDVIGAFGAPSDSANYSLNGTGGEFATGPQASANYQALAGFWQTFDAYAISLNCSDTVDMGSVVGFGKSALGNNHATCNVQTDAPSGYRLYWAASNANMINTTGGDIIEPYTPAVAGMPETWWVANDKSEWGAKLGSGSTTYDGAKWGTADDYADGKWVNITTSNTLISERTSATGLTGDNQVMWFGVEVGSDSMQPSGLYQVGIVMTALSL